MQHANMLAQSEKLTAQQSNFSDMPGVGETPNEGIVTVVARGVTRIKEEISGFRVGGLKELTLGQSGIGALAIDQRRPLGGAVIGFEAHLAPNLSGEV